MPPKSRRKRAGGAKRRDEDAGGADSLEKNLSSLEVKADSDGEETWVEEALGSSVSTGAAEMAAASLVERARHAVNTHELDLAQQFYRRALEATPGDASLMDEAAELLLQVNQPEDAKQLLTRSAELAPDAGAGKFLYLAQLSEGQSALGLYKKALRLLRRDLVRARRRHARGEEEAEEDVAMLQQQLCTSLVSVAELFMTDLCFQVGAEEACQVALDQAMAPDVDYGGPEPVQALASLRLCQQRPEDALPLAKESFRRLRACEPPPDYEFRVSTAKLLFECSDISIDCLDDALEVLSGLLQEDDDNVEIWYLMGTAFYRQNPPDLALAHSHLTRASEMLAKNAEVAAQAGEPFDGEKQARLVAEQLQLVTVAEKEGLGAIDGDSDSGADSDDDGDGGGGGAGVGGGEREIDGNDAFKGKVARRRCTEADNMDL